MSATKVLWAKFGRLYVNFGEPISCRDALARFDSERARRPQSGRKRDPDELFLHRIGYRIVDSINKVAMVTPTSLVAAVLLFNEKRGITREVLLARVGMLLEMAHVKHARLSQTVEDGLRRHRDSIAEARGVLEHGGLYHLRFALGEHSPLARAKGQAIHEAIDEVLARFIKVKHVVAHRFDDETVYVPVPEARINLDFYKNNLVHLLASEAIVATAIRGTLERRRAGVAEPVHGSGGNGGSGGAVAGGAGGERGVTDVMRVMEAAAFLSRTLQHEFIFDPEKGFAGQFAETLGRLAEGGLIHRTPGEDFAQVEIRVTEAGEKTLALLHRVLVPWLEAYWLIADVLSNLEEPMPSAKFIAEAQKLGRRRYQVGDITCPESASVVNFQHALNAWEEFGLIERKKKGRDTLIAAVEDPSEPDRLVALKKRLRDYFA